MTLCSQGLEKDIKMNLLHSRIFVNLDKNFYRTALILAFLCSIIGCGYISNARDFQEHPALKNLMSQEYPRIGMNQMDTKSLKANRGIIPQLAKFNIVIINKSEDLFVDGDSSYKIAKEIKAINPNVKVLQYLNISDVWDYQPTFRKWATHHPEVLLKDSFGNYVHPYFEKYGNHRYMMDSTNPEWQEYYSDRMKKITDQGMDGIFIDNTWDTNWLKLNLSPENFRQIQEGWETIMKKGRARIGYDKIIIGNSKPYPLFKTRDMPMFEGYLSPDKKTIDNYFKMTLEAKDYGQIAFDAVKYQAYTGSNFHNVVDTFLPVVLMTDNLWGFSYDTPKWFRLIDQLGKIGYPTKKAERLNNGILFRSFTKGVVYFNDSEEPREISVVPNKYITINSQPATSFTLRPLTGIVLKSR